MNDSTPVLILIGQPRPQAQVEVEELEATESVLTGNLLRRIEVEISVDGEELNEQLLQELQPAKPGGEALIHDTAGGSWRVDNRSYSIHGGDQFSHTIQLEEHEQLTLTRVEFGRVSVVPERWDLSGDKPMVLSLLVALDQAQHTELEQAIAEPRTDENQYFAVRQVGIREEPVTMRFGRCYWQPLDDGRTRHLVHLVAEQGDDDSDTPVQLLIHEPDLSRLKERSIAHSQQLDALIQELHTAGVLNDEAIRRIDRKSVV